MQRCRQREIQECFNDIVVTHRISHLGAEAMWNFFRENWRHIIASGLLSKSYRMIRRQVTKDIPEAHFDYCLKLDTGEVEWSYNKLSITKTAPKLGEIGYLKVQVLI